jgi:hypothetical protein
MNRMRRRTTRIFSETDKQELLEAIGACREACIRALAAAPIASETYKRAIKVTDAIDSLAEELTGDAEHFWTKKLGGSGSRQPES